MGLWEYKHPNLSPSNILLGYPTGQASKPECPLAALTEATSWGPEQVGPEEERLTQSPVANDLTSHVCAMKTHENPHRQGAESFWVGGHVEMRGEQLAPCPCPILCLGHLLHLAAPELYLFMINQ